MMAAFFVAWAVAMTVACFVVLGVVTVLEARDMRRAKAGRLVSSGRRPVPRIPEQRQPSPGSVRSAAAVVAVHDPAAFDAFLRELIVTPHVEDGLR